MTSPLLRFLGGHLLVGIAAGWLALAGLLWLDVGRLGTLIWASPDWPLILAMLLAVFALTFGSLAMGTGVMGLGRRERERREPPPSGTPAAARHPLPALARAAARRRR